MNPPRKAQVPVGKGIIFAGHKACVRGRFASKDERMAEYLRGEERESRQRWDGPIDLLENSWPRAADPASSLALMRRGLGGRCLHTNRMVEKIDDDVHRLVCGPGQTRLGVAQK